MAGVLPVHGRFRLVTFTVFTLTVLADVAPGRFFGVAVWEGLGALATAVGLWWDARRATADPAGPVGGPGMPVGSVDRRRPRRHGP